jgi:hypothetical protein
MQLIKGVIATVSLLLAVLISVSDAGNIPDSYEKVSWDSSVKSVVAKYPQGRLGKLAEELIYRQYKPNAQIARRNFAFREGKLHTVTVTYEKRYIEKHGIERLLQMHSKRYGEGVMDASQAPHMISWSWQSASTRILFAYAPKRPDMTVMIYEQSRPSVENQSIVP